MVQTKLSDKQTTGRESGIELLKIIAMFCIVLSHVVQTLCSENAFIPYQDYLLDLTASTTNIQHFVLIIVRYFGALGNSIFFVSSAWFWLSSSGFNKRKWLFMLVEIWAVSILILAITYIPLGGNLPLR